RNIYRGDRIIAMRIAIGDLVLKSSFIDRPGVQDRRFRQLNIVLGRVGSRSSRLEIKTAYAGILRRRMRITIPADQRVFGIDRVIDSRTESKSPGRYDDIFIKIDNISRRIENDGRNYRVF